MGVSRPVPVRGLVRAAWVLLGLAGLWAGMDGWHLLQAERLNARISAAEALPDDPAAPPQQRFAYAYAQAASGAAEAALNRYGALLDDSALGVAARYNSANVLLRQGIALRTGDQPGQALALIELAKEGYREVLRQDPDHWPARYNLERAQRLLPDPEALDEAPPNTERDAERAATTMRGYAPGMP